MSKILSKGITLSYAGSGSSASADLVPIYDLTSIPSLGGDKDKVETTTLANAARTYIPGLIDYGDLEFGFVYDDEDKYPSGQGSTATMTTFEYLKSLEAANNNHDWWKVAFPNSGIIFTFDGKPSVSMGAAEVGGRVDFTMKVGLQSDITVA